MKQECDKMDSKKKIKELEKRNKMLEAKINAKRTWFTLCNKCKNIIFTEEKSIEILKTKPEKQQAYGLVRRRSKIASYHISCFKKMKSEDWRKIK